MELAAKNWCSIALHISLDQNLKVYLFDESPWLLILARLIYRAHWSLDERSSIWILWSETTKIKLRRTVPFTRCVRLIIIDNLPWTAWVVLFDSSLWMCSHWQCEQHDITCWPDCTAQVDLDKCISPTIDSSCHTLWLCVAFLPTSNRVLSWYTRLRKPCPGEWVFGLS